jgi:GT2 family glycosyltransferase
MAIKTGIVLLNWNNWGDTCSCLESFRSLPHSKSELSYYVVDNGSQDESALKLQALEDIHLILLEENLGFAGGSNYGIQAALRDGCDYILLFNNDAYPKGDFLEPLLEVFQQDAQAGISSPKIYYAEPTWQDLVCGRQISPTAPDRGNGWDGRSGQRPARPRPQSGLCGWVLYADPARGL